MMVTFISQCEKKALIKTRRVLDSFANRIGNRTWQTVITHEGLNAVRKALRKTASKNTAVSCHWLRSRSRSELVWIVGNRKKFNTEGHVPVHFTERDVINTQWENDWDCLPLIKNITGLAALFHDWGKASEYFQKKLKSKGRESDPLRHEWVSVLLFGAFVNGEKDEKWLRRLSSGEIDEEFLKEKIKNPPAYPLENLPPLAGCIAWLILSHHKLPLPDIKEWDYLKSSPLQGYEALLRSITEGYGYRNDVLKKKTEECLSFPDGLLTDSLPWLKQVRKRALKLQEQLTLVDKVFKDGSWRIMLHHARLSLMLGDYRFSSQEESKKAWHGNRKLYANTDTKSGRLKQRLDEHITGVAKEAVSTAHFLPSFERGFKRACDIRSLKAVSPSASPYHWQDRAASRIRAWKQAIPEAYKETPHGVFFINMASTGCGKTLANAKVMGALSDDGESLRYALALGLRTLTLQTGDEYRNRIGLDDSELAVLIGSAKITELHKQQKQSDGKDEQASGSESSESLFDEEIDFDCPVQEKELAVILPDEKSRKFLIAPVLVCTIDYLMRATETKRGGRYILPGLRLISSDIVIDEIDDFSGDDLIAIGRLIHLAGMLGKKVMLSSATIPPALAEGYFHAYRSGWNLFAKTRKVSSGTTCGWIDEFSANIVTVYEKKQQEAIETYRKHHTLFIEKRIRNLKKLTVKRKGEIIPCSDLKALYEEEENLKEAYYHARLLRTVTAKHRQHCSFDEESGKYVSFGVVRIANIRPCIEVTKYFAEAEWDSDITIRVMAYHSRQVLLLRNGQEQHLDAVLKRKDASSPFQNTHIRRHLKQAETDHIIFILVATPVEEVGRDHDFDWAVIEPSSFRSIIQLAGRVLRHRDISPQQANIAIMQYNRKGLKGHEEGAVFCNPGYERKGYENRYLLKSHDMKKLVDEQTLAEGIDAIPRIKQSNPLRQNEKLVDLEHYCMQRTLAAYKEEGPESLEGWLSQCWWLTALPQLLTSFRKNEGEEQTLFLIPEKDGGFSFREKDKEGNPVSVNEGCRIVRKEISEEFRKKLWLHQDYDDLLQQQADRLGISKEKAALRYGEITFRNYKRGDQKLEYIIQLGLY